MPQDIFLRLFGHREVVGLWAGRISFELPCCLFSSLKTSLMPREPIKASPGVSVPGFAFHWFSGDTTVSTPLAMAWFDLYLKPQ